MHQSHFECTPDKLTRITNLQHNQNHDDTANSGTMLQVSTRIFNISSRK